jgi:hypothetical protein
LESILGTILKKLFEKKFRYYLRFEKEENAAVEWIFPYELQPGNELDLTYKESRANPNPVMTEKMSMFEYPAHGNLLWRVKKIRHVLGYPGLVYAYLEPAEQ